ncbi:hypothetical protein GUITHDRAFT_145302 [Guillardia theta CCMP2712]|uniref:Ion transport domain-containing protein n=1 Tax=Guillardia theta (strain CCMP2712) TaxID=905079 RepID=L1ILD7_GUITC|nr:hypothetical protein GUITHDRAFT_145302 [Guillardia theta CCMP2712]EKX37061.1 hypothetical protein GUITHDRAFT_145302 [Guillardia theta CCMP2712]|eukprot:XP_005824041.1 hypothetical protein GUITHDRAFT_145302 [Guillardia theta CCMP2712]
MAQRERAWKELVSLTLIALLYTFYVQPCLGLVPPAIFRKSLARHVTKPAHSGPPLLVTRSVKEKPEYAKLERRGDSEARGRAGQPSLGTEKDLDRREFMQMLAAVFYFVVGTCAGFFFKPAERRQKSLEEEMETTRMVKKEVEELSKTLSDGKKDAPDPTPPLVPLVLFFRRMLMLDMNKVMGTDSTFTELLLYRLDYFLSSSPYAKLMLLLNITMLAILGGSLLLVLFQGEDFGTALWESWTFVANPGTQANVQNPSERVIALSITVAGLLVFAVMIGLITETVSEKVDEFKKGKNRIFARDHVLILGFSEKCLDVRREEEEELVGGHGEVTFRSGNPQYASELEKVRIEYAKSILVLAGDEQDVNEADSDALRTRLKRIERAGAGAGAGAGVTTIEEGQDEDVDNKQIVALASNDSKILVVNDIVGQLMVIKLSLHCPQSFDVLLSIARDDDSYTVNDGSFYHMISHLDHIVPKGSELWLLSSIPVYQRRGLLEDVGQRENLQLVNLKIKHVYGNPTIRKDLTSLSCLDMFGDPTGQVVNLLHFDTIMVLADEFAMQTGSSKKSADGRSLASFLLLRDIRRLLLAGKQGFFSRPREDEGKDRIICEMLHASSSRMLLRELDCRGYVMSNRIVSSAMGQLLMNGQMSSVLAELLSPAGNELSIKPVTEYLEEEEEEEEEMSFWELADRALSKGHVLVGYKRKEEEFKSIVEMSEEEEENCTNVNPPEKMRKRRWRKEDVVVVLSRTTTFKK